MGCDRFGREETNWDALPVADSAGQTQTPAMAEEKRFRAFLPEFVAYMDRRGGFPDLKVAKHWLQDHGMRCKRD